jgi:hypothetical protein
MGLMLIPLLFIRVPRMGLHFMAEKKKEEKDSPFRYYEFMFRKYSMMAYFPVAFLLQIISGCAIYCSWDDAKLQAANGSSCRTGYVISFLIFLVIHTAFDYVHFKFVMIPELGEE